MKILLKWLGFALAGLVSLLVERICRMLTPEVARRF
jgi:hypothetical protein